jgi:hypothetical protein
MKKEFNIVTEGVLVIASSSALKSEYSEKEFDYDFPNGLSRLLDKNNVIALTTSEGDDLKITIELDTPIDWTKYEKVINQYLTITDENDELLIMSHAEFTMICRHKKGDYKKYGQSLEFVNRLKKGLYKIEIGIIYTGDDYDKHQTSFNLKINISETQEDVNSNEVFDIG